MENTTSAWEESKFPKADDPKDVGWLISYWRITPCYSECKPGEGYRLQSRQFDHLVKAATREEALAKFNKYVENRREAGQISGIKGQTLFLSRVDTIATISNNKGEIIYD